jgi:hypothetical protein
MGYYLSHMSYEKIIKKGCPGFRAAFFIVCAKEVLMIKRYTLELGLSIRTKILYP